MKVYVTPEVKDWARKAGVEENQLHKAAELVAAGAADASLGGGLYKKRIPADGKGARDGGRTILAWNRRDRVIFIDAFLKSEKTDLTEQEEETLRLEAKIYNNFSEAKMEIALKGGAFIEIERWG